MTGISRKILALALQLADPRWRHFYWQRRFRALDSRTKAADRIALRRGHSRQAQSQSATETGMTLRTEGFLSLGKLLDLEQCEELVRYFSDKPVRDFYRPEIAPFFPHGKGRHPHTSTGQHDEEDILRAPYLLELANRPDIMAVLEGYFGCKPTISTLSAWWSYPTGIGAQQAENFHRDVDDWRFVKLFVYLTDVDESNGPHVFVRWSPADEKLTEIRRYQDDEVVAAFGRQAIMQITGGAGTAFLENTFGLHKGTPLEQGKRLLFQAIYSLAPLPYGPRKPMMPQAEVDHAKRFDPWVNRVYLSRQ